jgi:pimeloyl-ACP methyl ester carboxylesterase
MPEQSKRFPVLLALVAILLPLASFAQAQERYRVPVEVVAANTIPVAGSSGAGLLPIYANRGLDSLNGDVDRAVIVIHGRLRNAGTYFQSALAALEASGDERSRTLLIAPQFLAEVDTRGRAMSPTVLRWGLDAWQSGEDAAAPAPVSSFEALDSLLARLSDPALFPALRSIVLVGHSAGGQVVQRYAILGRGEDSLRQRGVHLRYVVANSSSYAYFDASRPDREGHFATFPAASCPKFNTWRYGMNDLPRYAAGNTPASAEQRYVQRDVVYLLGTDDTNPNHSALDKTCMAESQGPERLARGEAYFAYLKERHPRDLAHRLVHVQGVGHNGDRMLTSECGMSVLFDRPDCGSS